MDQKLAVEKLKPLFFSDFGPNRQNRVLLKLNDFIAARADQMMVVGQPWAVQLVIFKVIAEVQFSQDPHLGHQLEGPVNG